MLQAVITRLMHPEVINIRYFWCRFTIFVIAACGYLLSMTSGLIVTNKTSNSNSTGWGASNIDWMKNKEYCSFISALSTLSL